MYIYNDRLFYIISVILFIFSYTLFHSVVYLSPINDTMLYMEYDSTNLYPFSSKTSMLMIKNTVRLKLLDELYPENNLFDDILFVEVDSGYYKGQKGYIEKSKTRISGINHRNPPHIIIKRIPDNNSLKYNQSYPVMYSKIVDGKEIITINTGTSKNENPFNITDKNLFRFYISETKDIEYHNRQNNLIIKIVDSDTLLPVQNAYIKKSNYRSSSYGIIYIPYEKKLQYKNIAVTADNFTENIIDIRENNNIYIAFLKEKRNNNTLEDFYYEIDNRNLSCEYYNYRPYSTSFFEINDTLRANYRFHNGIELISPLDKTFNLTLKKNSKVSNLVEVRKDRLIEIPFQKSDNPITKISPLKTYFIVKKKDKDRQSANFKSISSHSSDFYLIGKDNFYYKHSKNSISKIPEDNYEIIYFTSESPYFIRQETVNHTGFTDFTPDEYKQEKIYHDFNHLSRHHAGKWEKIENRGQKNTLEELGDLTLYDNGRIEFTNNKNTLKGFYNITDETLKHMKIIINYSKLPVYFEKYNLKSYIFPSLFHNQLIIYAIYDYYAGMISLNFNNIKLKNFRDTENISFHNNSFITSNSEFVFNETFPENEKTNYKLFFEYKHDATGK